MRFFFILAVIAAALIWGAYFALIQVGLIDEGCPAASSRGDQVVIDNQLDVNIRARVHDAAEIEMVVLAQQCVLVNITRRKVALETWVLDGSGVPNCITELLPAQLLTLYERGGVTFCDIGHAEISSES